MVPFQQEFPTKECGVKNYPVGLPESDKKIRLHPKTSDSDTATLFPNVEGNLLKISSAIRNRCSISHLKRGECVLSCHIFFSNIMFFLLYQALVLSFCTTWN